MRVRTIATVVILSAGCSTSGTARSSGRPASVAAWDAPAMAETPAIAATPAAPAPTVTSLPAPVAAAAVTSSAAPVDLYTLANELRAAPRGQVSATDARFRPLCYAAGYPLVGNLITKESPSTRNQRYDVTEHCAAVRSAR